MTPHTQITFSAGVNHYRFPAPEWGYKTTIETALLHAPLSPRGYGVWDNGVAKSHRVCHGCAFMLDATDANTMAGMLRNANRGRGVDVTLSLPPGSGFYPFGPDKGDAGNYTVRVIEFLQGKQLEEPYNHFRHEISMVCSSYPAYALPTQINEGALQIGAVTALRWPPDWSDSVSVYDVTTQLTRDGSPYSVDKTIDRYETTLPMLCNQSKGAALLDHMVTTVRDNTLTLTPPANTYIFGRDNVAAAYTCQWLDREVEVRHEMYDRFLFPLRFYMQAAA